MTHAPSRQPRLATWTFLIFAGSALVLALGMDRALNPYDEGVILTGALRVAAGEVPHRDFYANYGPGQFYLLALLFKLAGPYVWIERALDILVRAGIVALSYALTAHCARPLIALTTAALSTLWLLSVSTHGYPMFPAVLLALAGASLLSPTLGVGKSAARLGGAGAMVGATALFRYEVGFLIFIAYALAIVFSASVGPGTRGRKLRSAGRMLLLYILGTSAVFLPPAVLYLTNAPVSAFIHDLVSYPLQHYPAMRRLPLPGIFDPEAAVYLPLVICCAAVYRFRGQFARLRADANDAEGHCKWIFIVLGLATAALYAKGWVRVSIVHMIGALISSLVVLGALIERTLSAGTRTRLLAGALGVLSLLVAMHAAVEAVHVRHAGGSLLFDAVRAYTSGWPQKKGRALCTAPRELPGIDCFILSSDRLEAARYLVKRTKPDERVFVGLARHDKIFINDNITYFAARRLPATRWHHFDPGLQTRADVQADIVRELEARGVRYAVITSEWDHVSEPNESSQSSGVHLLDAYLREKFVVIEKFGAISVLARDSQ